MSITFLSEETTKKYEYQWFVEQLKELSSGKYDILRKDKKEWYSIVSNKNGTKSSFILS